EIDRNDRHQNRDEADVGSLDPAGEVLHVAPQCMLHFAKLLANSNRFVPEAFDRLLLLRRQDRRALALLLLLEILQSILGLLQLRQQFLFLGAEAALGLPLDLLNGRERPLRDAASAQPDELAAAG